MMQEVEEPLLENAEDCDVSPLDVSINQGPPSPDTTMISEENIPMTSRQVMKNMFVLCFSMFMFFVGFMSLTNLQSTMNAEKGIGTESQAAIYVASMVSALTLPEFLVKNFGCKNSLIAAVTFSIPYILANFLEYSPTLLIISAVSLGLAAGPLTTAQSFFVNELARRYHADTPTERLDDVVAKFYGFNSFGTENTQIWGNLISYFVLRPSMTPVTNQTNITNCGVDFINHDMNATNFNLTPPTSEQRHTLVGIYTACAFISIFVMCYFLDPLKNDVEQDEVDKGKCRSVGKRFVAAVKHALKTDQVMLIPLSVYCGIATSFYASDFTQAFIACSWGVHHVGFVTICFGVCGALMSILVGPLVKFTSQMCVILFAAVINVVTCAMLFVWEPTPESPVIYFVFAGVWGMTDAIWWSQIAALYGLMFPNDREAAFSNFFFWSFLGYFLSYSYANYFTVAVKINIMLVFLIVGIIMYTAGQIKLKCCTSRSTYIVIDES